MSLETQIKEDIERVGLPTDFKLELRGYSVRLDGTYNPEIKRVVIYAREENGMLRDYDEIIEIAIHEAVHHYQWNYEEGFVRRKGVMHNAKFHKKYNECISKLKEGLNVTSLKEDMDYDYRLFI